MPLVGGESPNYYVNVKNAFDTAPHLPNFCAQLPGEKVMLAHSLGNVVVSSASVDYGLQYKKYYMLNAAVPMEAYDIMSRTTNMVGKAWRSTPSRIRSSEWSNLFDREDGRSLLSWRGRFAGIANAVNCYSTTEDVLGNTDLNESQVGRWWNDRAWAMQEMNKGTQLAEMLPDSWANSEGGWGFNLSAYGERYINRNTLRMTTRMKRRISRMSDDELKANPVFKPFDEDWLHSTNGFVSVPQIDIVRARILGDGIPAISFAAGANQMHDRAGIIQLNYHLYEAGFWPREYDDCHNPIWQHSDIKKVAYHYLSGFFKIIVSEEEK